MDTFTELTAIAAPLIRADIDTDTILPADELKRASRRGLGEGLFAPWRYKDLSERAADPGFVLNKPEYAGAKIILSGENFGCGLSREAAVWALYGYGIRCIIAPSFGDSFYRHSVQNGLLPVRLSAENIERIVAWCAADSAPDSGPGTRQVDVDLVRQEVVIGNEVFTFEIDDADKRLLVEGAEAKDEALDFEDEILLSRPKTKKKRPWAELDAPLEEKDDGDEPFFERE